jgi:Ring finger domain
LILSCSICLVELAAADEISEINECRHIFHTECIRTWFEQKNECPLCKIKLEFYKPEADFPARENFGPVLIEFMQEMMQATGQMQEYMREMRHLNNALEDLRPRDAGGRRVLNQDIEQAIIGLTLNAHLHQLRRTVRQQMRQRVFEPPNRAPEFRMLRFHFGDH